MPPEAPTFPLTAWEQAVVVVIFAVVALSVSALAGAGMRWLLNWAAKREADWQDLASKRESGWQDFIRELRNLDIKARSENQERTETMMSEVRTALTEMASAITELTGEFKDHVVDENARWDVLMDEAQKSRAVKTRKAKDGSG